jgi:hypothetical protein
MIFFRHQQIYRPISLVISKRDSFATVPPSSSHESATGYSLASCTPAVGHQTVGLGNQARNKGLAAAIV